MKQIFKLSHFPLAKIKSSRLLQNSMWGISSNILQNILLSLFFICIARSFSTNVFAQFLVATNIYQFIAAVSSLGLGQWFIREYIRTDDKNDLVLKFLKMQLCFGLIFYCISAVLSYVLYTDPIVRQLSLVLGINIILDNIIYSIKNLNIAQENQKKTFSILLIDAVLKFILGASLFMFPVSVLALSVIMILIRFATLNLFFKIGVSVSLSIRQLWKTKLQMDDIKRLLLANWAFIVIGSVSIIFWRIGSIIISKTLSAQDIADYEVSFKIFVIVQIFPLIASAAFFPRFISLVQEKNMEQLKDLFNKVFLLYFLFGLFSYTAICSFSNTLVVTAFGNNYTGTSKYVNEMFLSMIIFPTVYLQANLIVALKKEKIDMYLNVVSLFVYLLLSLVGMHFVKSLSVINYSIFISFLIFHLLQDIVLVRSNLFSLRKVLLFYTVGIAVAVGYSRLLNVCKSTWLFTSFWLLLLILSAVGYKARHLLSMEKSVSLN